MGDDDHNIGITNVDYPVQSSHMNRLGDQNENADTSPRIDSFDEHSDESMTNKEKSDENPFISFISSISERLNAIAQDDKDMKEAEGKEHGNENDDGDTDKQISRNEESKDANSFLSYFNAVESQTNHTKYEKFQEDTSIVLEEKLSEEKMEIHIETTVQISPSPGQSVTSSLRSEKISVVANNKTKDISERTSDVSRKNSSVVITNNTQEHNSNMRSINTKSKKKSKNVEDQATLLSKLAMEVPEATDAERKRFLIARKDDFKGAKDQLQDYVAWRKECRIDEEDAEFGLSPPMGLGSYTSDDGYISCASSVGAQDRSDWAIAADAAVAYYDNKDSTVAQEKKESDFNEVSLPQLAHMVTAIGSETYLKDKKGHRILLLLPAQVNIDDVNEETYALAIGFYLDRKVRIIFS